jgi:metal-dependent HD superfamily phosphatase/phosphodiesterase
MGLVFWHDPRQKIHSAIEKLGVSNSEERMNINIRDANHAGLFDIQRIIHYKYVPPKK